jgi:hypothetical protein
MARDRRTEYLRKWFSKAEREEDRFDRFIYGWLALTIAAQRYCTESGSDSTETDRERVISYLKHHATSVDAAIQKNRVQMVSLANRTGTRGGVVVDGWRIEEHCVRFRNKIQGGATCSTEQFAEAVGEILNKVRNNLFHGSKVYDDAEDRELLGLVTPLLLTILDSSERLTDKAQLRKAEPQL